MARTPASAQALAHLSRLKVMYLVLRQPGISLAELSEETGLHANTLRDHLRILEDEGFILTETEPRTTRGRPRTVYHAVTVDRTNPAAEQRIQEAIRHGEIYRNLINETSPKDLDEEALRQIDVLYKHLDQVGLDPDIDEDSLTVDLVPCPFHGLIDANQELACAVHETLIHTMLERTGGPVRLQKLLPYTTPHACRAHLGLAEEPPAEQEPA